MTRNTSMSKLSTTAYSTIVRRLPILTYNVVLRLVLSHSFDADKGDGCTSLHILDRQSKGSRAFEIKFEWDSVSRNQVTRYIILSSLPIKRRRKYEDCSATAIIEVYFAY